MEPSFNIAVGTYSEADFSPPRDECPHPEWWHTHDFQATEIEVIDMVAGLIRGLQPDTVLETGTSRGFLAHAICTALTKNGHGRLYTYEPDLDVYEEAAERLAGFECVDLFRLRSMSPWRAGPIHFAWFDSLLELRRDELEFYRPFFTPSTVLGFHDTAPRFGSWSSHLRHTPDLHFLDLPTPRGVILARIAPK